MKHYGRRLRQAERIQERVLGNLFGRGLARTRHALYAEIHRMLYAYERLCYPGRLAKKLIAEAAAGK